jgi:hypothetical protein
MSLRPGLHIEFEAIARTYLTKPKRERRKEEKREKEKETNTHSLADVKDRRAVISPGSGLGH